MLGAVKADIGIKDGRIVGVGRAGNDAVSDGIDLPIGPHTQPIMGYGLIATPGAIDSHVHLISPELLPAALSGGVTTLITAGFEEPPVAMARLLDAIVDWPLNVGLQACARSEDVGSLEALLDAGACGFKIHEDYGADPALIDHTLRIRRDVRRRVALHTDGLHESAELEDTVAAIDGRTVHAYHVEGSGGGHVPDVIGLVREPNIICSSTTPTVPWGVAAAAEQVPMIVLNHGASFGVADDLALVRDRVHEPTMAAEGPLHELGAIAIVNSDSQGMGRMMETVRRTFQLAHVMRGWTGTSPAPDDRRRHGPRPALPRQGDDRAGDHPRPGRRTSARSSPGGWPTSCCGSRPTSASSRRSCSRAASSRGRPSVKATPRSKARSRPAIDRTGADWAARPPPVRSRSSPAAVWTRPIRPASGLRTGSSSRSHGTRGLTRADLVHNRVTAVDRGRCPDGRSGWTAASSRSIRSARCR